MQYYITGIPGECEKMDIKNIENDIGRIDVSDKGIIIVYTKIRIYKGFSLIKNGYKVRLVNISDKKIYDIPIEEITSYHIYN